MKKTTTNEMTHPNTPAHAPRKRRLLWMVAARACRASGLFAFCVKLHP